MTFRAAVLGFLMLVPLPALAEGPESGNVDVFLVPHSAFEATYRVPPPFIGAEFHAEGRGIGVRAMVPLFGPVVVLGEYQEIRIDGSEDGIRSLRGGAGIAGESTSGIYFVFESFKIDDDFEFNGAALLGRAAGNITDRFSVYGELAYAALRRTDANVADDKDYAGFEFSVGAVFQLNYRFGIFGDYRVTTFAWSESGYELQLDLSDLRMGGRIQFGG